MAEYSSGDFTDSSTSNARHRRRQRETDMETDVNTHSSSCRLNRPSTPENATTGQGSGHNEIRLEKTRKVLNIVQNIAAFKPEIEREFDALEEMARRMSLRQSDVESPARIQELERQIAELREENTRNREDSDVKLKAKERLNYRLQQEVKKLQKQNGETEQKLAESQNKLSLAEDELRKEIKAREDSQEQVQKFNALHDTYAAAFKKEKQKRGEMQQQLQDNTETIEVLTNVKEHLNQMINAKDSALHEQKKELDTVRKELDETKSRLSKMMGSQMKEGNPYIADLSDKNRPTKIADTYSELYDNEWTDAFDELQKSAYRKDDKDIARQLYDMLMDINMFCKKEAEIQTNRIKESLLADNMEGKLIQSTQHQLKEFQRSNAVCGIQGVCQKYLKTNRNRSSTMAFNARKVPDFVKRCTEVCWIMALQDPPLDFKDDSAFYAPFSKDEFKAYTKFGQYIDYIVWPPLLLHKGGPLLAKGVAQGLGAPQGGMKSPDVQTKEMAFPLEPKKAWTTTAQAESYPSTITSGGYAQSPQISSVSYPINAFTSSYEETTVAPSTYHPATIASASSFSQSQSSSHFTNTKPSGEGFSTGQARINELLHQASSVGQKKNADPSRSQQSGSFYQDRNAYQQDPISQMATGHCAAPQYDNQNLQYSRSNYRNYPN